PPAPNSPPPSKPSSSTSKCSAKTPTTEHGHQKSPGTIASFTASRATSAGSKTTTQHEKPACSHPEGRLIGVPGHLHLTLGVAGLEQPEQLVLAGFVEPLMRLREQPPGPVQRIFFVSTVPECLVLHPASTLVQFR